ncbi:hypothetical protein HY29_00125 [Hyphomonas beringensis]|uniref:Protein-export membrane protein SecG n=1 Tax=Hyphomonas beringensis TaxID=1280946 RepID=A0A062UFV9_9PROT|nr:preprotein translocase subunit SecG [Hyphomonas beringensis]KCZ57167.1 hypothetical protein HY29_00125 [Hyphomonas beringensis]
MQTVILTVHIIASIVMTGLVLLQKSEGGGLGLGGGGGGGAGAMMSGRGAAGALVRSTIIFGGIFFVTSLALTTLANRNNDTRTEVERALGADETDTGTGSATDLLDPTDILDPTAPLLEGQEGLGEAEAEAADSVPETLTDPTVDTPVELAPEDEATATETAPEGDDGESNPQ